MSRPDEASPFDAVVGGSILGSEGFVRWVRDNLLRGREDISDVAGLADLRPRPAVDSIIAQVTAYYEVRPQMILARGHKNNRERDVAIYLARELTGLSGRKLGHHFGGLKGPAIAMRCAHMLACLAEDRRLAKDIAQLRRTITDSE